jgi:hypothetical protein
MPDVTTTDTSTRLAWQMLGEHVLSAARHAATGKIGLRQTPGGVGTPPFPFAGGERRILVVGAELVLEDGTDVRRQPITTLAAAGDLVGITPGAPSDVYTPSTALDLSADLGAMIDPDAAQRLAAFYELTQAALVTVCTRHADLDPAEIQLWPEHFDLATTIAEVNLGGSPGDAAHERPYLYVGPWSPRRGPFWNESFGASRSLVELPSADAVASFFEEGLRRAAEDPPAS